MSRIYILSANFLQIESKKKILIFDFWKIWGEKIEMWESRFQEDSVTNSNQFSESLSHH